jgi:hypothetical protein
MLREPALDTSTTDVSAMQSIEAGLRRFVHELVPLNLERLGDLGVTLIASATCFDDSEDVAEAPPVTPLFPSAA